MEQFKIYLKTETIKLSEELQEITENIKNLPHEEIIITEDHNHIRKLKQEYRKNSKQTLLTKIKPITKKELSKYLKDKKYSELITKKKELTIKIDEINSLISVIKDNQITGEIKTSDEIIKLLFTYFSSNSISCQETITILLEILRNTKKTDHINSKIKQNIVSLFNNSNELTTKENYNTIKLLFEKLFITLYTGKELEQNNHIITEIIIELKLQHTKENNLELKGNLISQRNALQELHKYIKNGEVIASIEDYTTFKELIKKSKIDSNLATTLLNQMEERIKKDRLLQEELERETALKNLLNKEEQAYIGKAIEYESKTTGQLQSLISRTKNDVISICKYLQLVQNTTEFQNTIDVLSKRVSILKELINSLEKNENNKSVFYYLTNNESMPYILRTIDTLDITSHACIYSLLYQLSRNPDAGKLAQTIEGIRIYELKNESYQLKYIKFNNEIIIINLYSKYFNPETPAIDNQLISQVKELINSSKKAETKNLHSKYEKLILKSLNQDIRQEKLTLSKKGR